MGGSFSLLCDTNNCLFTIAYNILRRVLTPTIHVEMWLTFAFRHTCFTTEILELGYLVIISLHALRPRINSQGSYFI